MEISRQRSDFASLGNRLNFGRYIASLQKNTIKMSKIKRVVTTILTAIFLLCTTIGIITTNDTQASDYPESSLYRQKQIKKQNAIDQTVFFVKTATISSSPPVTITVTDHVAATVDFETEFLTVYSVCYTFKFSSDNALDPNEAFWYTTSPKKSQGAINRGDSPITVRGSCVNHLSRWIFLDGYHETRIRMGTEFGANPNGSVILSSIDVSISGIPGERIYLPVVFK
ncbi:MAG: hypothetical protein GY797_41360 [Deltaproteobacteria bacterium]|nr:hypothetical protein [Deltaproteobacteria bacterium]